MRSIVYGAIRGVSMIDWEGHLSKVIFIPGCNFRCGFCHNAELLHPQHENLTEEELDTLLSDAKGQWVDAIVVSGGEPLLNPELPQLIQKIKSFGYAIKVDTNGSAPEMLKTIAGEIDYVAMDYKASESRYDEITKVASPIEKIRESVRFLRDEFRGAYELRLTVIEQFHDDEQIRDICREIQGVQRFVLQAFVPREGLVDPAFERFERTKPNYLAHCAQLCKESIPTTLVRGA